VEWGPDPVHVLGFKPCAQPGIVDLRFSLPETGCQPTLNLQMIQLQLDDSNVFWEITPDIVCSYVQPGNSEALTTCFDYHTYLLLIIG
jgi:hypothetical protein